MMMRARVYSYRQVIESEYSSSVDPERMNREVVRAREKSGFADDGLALPARSPVDDSGRPPRY